MAPLPILPILIATAPIAVEVIHGIFGESKTKIDIEKVRELLESAEAQLSAMQAQVVGSEKKQIEAEAQLGAMQAQMVEAEKKQIEAEAQLGAMQAQMVGSEKKQIEAEVRLDEMKMRLIEAKRCKWPRCWWLWSKE